MDKPRNVKVVQTSTKISHEVVRLVVINSSFLKLLIKSGFTKKISSSSVREIRPILQRIRVAPRSQWTPRVQCAQIIVKVAKRSSKVATGSSYCLYGNIMGRFGECTTGIGIKPCWQARVLRRKYY
jgi:hypothetical protein